MSAQIAGLRRFAARRKTDAWQAPHLPVFVVAGAKGGSGTSTLAALLALSCAADGRTTLLIDTDDVTGTQHRLFGVRAPRGFASLQDPAVSSEGIATAIDLRLSVIAGGIGNDEPGAPLDTAQRRAVFRRLSALYDGYDAIIIDAGSRLDGIIAAGERGAWRFLNVTSSDPIALASSYAIVKALETRWPGAPIEVLMNQQDELRGRAGFEHIRAGAEHFLGRSVQYAGAIPREAAVADAAQTGRPLRTLSDVASAGQAAARIAVRLLADFDDPLVS